MSNTTRTIITFLTILYTFFESTAFGQSASDTSTININTRNAINYARKNPDSSINLAHKALTESRKINYKKGLADASFALGTAYLAKYNIDDSALFYNKQSYDIYNELNDKRGKAMACYGLTYVYSIKGDLEESEKYGALSLEYFKQAGDKRGMVNSYNALSYLAKQKKDFDKARSLIQQSITIAGSVNDTLPLADALNSLGNIYKDMALFNHAIDTYFEALRLWELKGDSNGISIAYGSIALMYYYQRDWDKALEFSLRKMPVAEDAGDLWEVSKNCNLISQIYNSKGRHDSALLYLRKSLRLNEEMNYPSGIAAAYQNLASTFLLDQETDSAYYYISGAVELAKKIDDPALLNYYVTLGNVQKVKGNYTLALKNALEAYRIGKKQQMPLAISESSALLSEIYSLMKRNDLAYNYLKEHYQLRDSISNDEFLSRVTRLEIQYEYNKKQRAAELAQLEERMVRDNKIKQQKQYVKGLLVLLFLVAIISLLYIRHNQLRAKYSRINLEQRLLRAQMNPHFIFNSLCAVQDFILAGKPQKANIFLTKIARLMRNILENSREEFISLEKEVETLRLFLDIQQLRFETEFEYNIKLDELIDEENYSVPPMLTQPCVENSIEHGLLQSNKKGVLNIEYILSNGLIRLEVTDNGIGRKRAAAVADGKREKISVSSKLTSERLDRFKKTLHNKGISYEIVDLYDDGKASGTKVIMMLPYRKIYA